MKPNQQEKCAHKKNLGESCSQCNEAWNDMTSPHQEGWAERLKKLLQVVAITQSGYLAGRNTIDDCVAADDKVMELFQEALTTLHKADCERFRGMIGKDENIKDGSETWELVNKYRKQLYKHAVRNRNNLRAELRTALSKMEEEK